MNMFRFIYSIVETTVHILLGIGIIVRASLDGTTYPHQTNGGDNEYARP
jgi:hypothetical protein